MGNGFTEDSVAATVEHYTPGSIFDALGEQFDLDPCHPTDSPAWLPVRRFIKWFLTKEMDGLATSWPVGSYVFCNSPYGRECALWLAKMAAHGNGIALVFARTGTKWFHSSVQTADAICFMKGRVRFIDQDGVEQGPAKADSMLIAWGPRAVAALKRSGLGAMMYFNHAPVLSLAATVPMAVVPRAPRPPVVDDSPPLVCKCGRDVEGDFSMFCNACKKVAV